MRLENFDNGVEGLQEPKIETLRVQEDYEASFSPERGGIITSIKLKGTELLYMDNDTFKDQSINVKGGIPIMFPNAGPIESPDYPGLKQHGFARTSSTWKRDNTESINGFSETLESDEATKEVYPYDASLGIRGQFEDDNSFSIYQEATNNESNKEMPISMGLHPYFNVVHEEKENIKFNFKGGEKIEEAVKDWANGGTIEVDNPKVEDPDAILRVELPSLGTLVIDVSEEYKKIWVWSLPNKDFVCIEPVMRSEGGLVDDPEKIKPGQTLSAKINIRLED